MNSDLPAPPKFLWVALSIAALTTVAGINFVEWLKDDVISYPDPKNWYNSFFVVTTWTEPAGLYVFLGFCLVVALLFLRKSSPEWGGLLEKFSPRQMILSLAAGSFLVSFLGIWLVAHNHPLACDEFMPDFQARIFLSGKLQAEIPENLRFAAHSLAPLLSMRTADDSHWNSGYLPIYSAIRTPFLALHVETLVNPLFGALSVLSMAGIIRLLWPTKPWLAVAGAAMTALSPQILVNDMTIYAMPAHLALNLVWLWLYLQPEKKRFWLAPVVGVLAVGLHSPFVHALFVLPFLLRLLLERRWNTIVIFGVIYLAGCFSYWYWWHVFAPGNANPTTPLFVWHTKKFLFTQPLNVINLMSWNTLPCIILALIGLRFFKSIPIPIRDGTMSCLLTFTFYAFIAFDQSYGWGNRYCYGILGCLILLAVAGLERWSTVSQGQAPQRFFVLGLALTVLISIPLRFWQVERFIRPFAETQKHFQSTDADLLIFDTRMGWNIGDLLRNNPTLNNRPIIANQRYLTQEDDEALKKIFPRIHFVSREELAGYGISTVSLKPKQP